MGLDLKLLPAYSQDRACDFSSDVITLERDYDLFEPIQKAESIYGIPVHDDGINSYQGSDSSGVWEGTCYGNTKTLPFGDFEMKYLTASRLVEVMTANPGRKHWRNEAAAMWLTKVPPNLPIYLYWN